MKLRSELGVLCYHIIPVNLKGKFYNIVIRPTMLYVSECWTIKN